MLRFIIGVFIVLHGLVHLFPPIPPWIGKIFPTYYVIIPVMEFIEVSASFSNVALDVFIHLLINLALITAVVIVDRRLETTSLSKIVGKP